MNTFAQEEEPQFHNPKQYVTAVVEIWINNFTRLRKYVLKTCELLAPEYDCAPAVITGCHLVGVNGHGIVLGYVCKDKWPDPQQLRILQNISAPFSMRPLGSETNTRSPTLCSRGGSGLRADTREIYDNRWRRSKVSLRRNESI